MSNYDDYDSVTPPEDRNDFERQCYDDAMDEAQKYEWEHSNDDIFPDDDD